MAKNPLPLPHDEADPRVLGTLAWVRRVCLVLAALTAAMVLSAWILPVLDRFTPASWKLMKANTALCILLCSLSLQLCRSKLSRRAHLVSRVLAAVVAIIATATLYEYARDVSFGIDTLLAPDLTALHGRMAPQTAVAFLLLAVVLYFIRAAGSLLASLIDVLTSCLVAFMLVLMSGYFFGALHLLGRTTQNRVAPQSLFCLLLLTVVTFNCRARFGAFAILTTDTIAGKTSRFAAPFALGLPFLLEVFRSAAVKSRLLHYEYATATATTAIALLAFGSIFIMARRIQSLEQNIRDLSLRDELTGLYNRRGFLMLAGQALRLAQRLRQPFFVLFFDMDNLKKINDTQGHEAGSALLHEMAAILTSNFREIDVIGRIGGDEFVVAGNAGPSEIAIVIHRLEAATARANQVVGRSFAIEYSYGHVTSDAAGRQTLDELLDNADRSMYQSKRDKRRHPESKSAPLTHA